MFERKRITYLKDKKLILLVPPGLSTDEMNELKFLDPTIRVYKDKGVYSERFGVSYKFDESLINDFPDFQKIMFIKNPYWRTLEIYLWQYLYRVSYGTDQTQSFKKTIKKLYEGDVSEMEYENKLYVSPQNISLTKNYFICENFGTELQKWFGNNLESIVRPNIRSIKPSSIYDLTMETASDFYDRECAEMVYEKNRQIFEEFNYDFYSYLDSHNPVKKIHALHGDPINKFEI